LIDPHAKSKSGQSATLFTTTLSSTGERVR
jgi:hypothetical protein